MKSIPRYLLIIVLLLAFGTLYGATLSEIEEQLMCQCGCTMVLASCQCGSADKMRAEIQAKLDKGIPSKEIIESFVATYGEEVLSAPTKRGFNLTAWLIPSGAVVAGMILLWFVVREFARKREKPPEIEYSEKQLERFRKKLDEELKDYM